MKLCRVIFHLCIPAVILSSRDNSHGIPSFRSRRLDLSAGTETNTYDLTATGCYAPYDDYGDWGYCGPESCRENYSTCASVGGGPKTVDGVTGDWNSYYSGGSGCATWVTNDVTDITDWSPTGPCDSSCTQQTTGICSAEFLNNVLVGFGVKYAYCSDKYLVIVASGEAGGTHTPNMNDTPFPPAAGADFTQRTGMDTLDTSRFQELYIPLSVTELSTDDTENNLASFDVTTGSGPFSYLVNTDDGVNYGLPSDAGIGMAVNGMPIFPVYNNVARYTPSKCEVDSCNEHVGQGGGAAHFHGDPYADDWDCLYGSKNYTSTDSHPPVIGFSYDGYLIYGRYLSTGAPGYDDPSLDNCGGHSHNEATDVDDNGISLATYHYHTQIFDGTVLSGETATEGESYVVSTTGPYQCWKADLSASTGSSALLSTTADADGNYDDKNTMSTRCCSMTDYYMITGLDFPDTSASYDSTSTCSAPGTIDNGSYGEGACQSGETMLSGYTCVPDCDSGFEVNGETKCVGGTLSVATCEAATSAPTVSKSPTASPTLPTTESPTNSPTTPAPTVSKSPTDSPTLSPTGHPTIGVVSTDDDEGTASVDTTLYVWLGIIAFVVVAGASYFGYQKHSNKDKPTRMDLDERL